MPVSCSLLRLAGITIMTSGRSSCLDFESMSKSSLWLFALLLALLRWSEPRLHIGSVNLVVTLATLPFMLFEETRLGEHMPKYVTSGRILG